MKKRFPRPEVRSFVGGLKPRVDETQRMKDIFMEDLMIMVELLKEYDIPADDPHCWYWLALRLAKEKYTEPKGKGRPSKWKSLSIKTLLYMEMKHCMEQNPRFNVGMAAKKLAKFKHWQNFIESKDDDNTTPNPAMIIREQFDPLKKSSSLNSYYQELKSTNQLEEFIKKQIDELF
mgnify:CR=1 FL=1